MTINITQLTLQHSYVCEQHLIHLSQVQCV